MTTLTKTNETYVQQPITSEVVHQQVMSRLSVFLMIIVVLLAGVTFYQNIFAFPAYQDTEGTNIANAWAFLNEGEMAPYTYAYDNPPTGTFVLGGWAALFNGFDSFGFEINTGRTLMMVFHLLSVALVFTITHRLSGSNLAAVAAVLLFALSPLALSIQRRVLLDNMMLVFLLAAFDNVIGDRKSLYHYVLSGVLFGAAVLLHTDALIFFPALVYGTVLTSHRQHRRFAVTLWAAFAVLIISLYPMYAQMRTELFPQGWLFGGDFPHVSLMERMLDRGPDTGTFMNIGSGLLASFQQWTDISHLTADPILIYGGLLAVLFIMVMAQDNIGLRPLAAMVITFLIMRFFGGQVAPTDVIALLPFLAISIAIVLALFANMMSSVLGDETFLRPLLAMALLAGFLYPFTVFYMSRAEAYTLDQVSGQMEALAWVEENIPADAVLVTDNYAFVALREIMPNAHHYWKVDTDPDVKYTILGDDPCSIDYLVTTPQVMQDIDVYNLGLLSAVLADSEKLLTYENNGWPVDIWQVQHTYCSVEALDSGAAEAISATSVNNF